MSRYRCAYKKLAINPMDSITKAPSPGESNHGIALDDEQLKILVQGFRGSALYGIVSVAAFTGARRNEILALRWSSLEPQTQELKIERALEETKAHGLRIKGPKKESHKRKIRIDDDLLALLLAEREKHLRIIAGLPDSAAVDLSLIKLPEEVLMFPNPPGPGREITFTAPRRPRVVTKEFARKARKLGFKLRLHDLRGTHETLLLDRGVPVHVVAARCGHDPAGAAAQLRQANAQGRYQRGKCYRQHIEGHTWLVLKTFGSKLGPSRKMFPMRSLRSLC
jgi:integrase